MAQCLSAAEKTVPISFLVSKMHCYFILAADADTPIFYHVTQFHDDTASAMRTVHAMQTSRLIFTASLVFRGITKVCHKGLSYCHSRPPPVVYPPTSEADPDAWDASRSFESRATCTTQPENEVPGDASSAKIHQWMHVRGHAGNDQRFHLPALVYMSDSFLLGSVPRIHRIPRYSSPDALRNLKDLESQSSSDSGLVAKYLGRLARKENLEYKGNHRPGSVDREVSMLVTLSHVIYFHNPAAVRADDWLLSEVQSPWAGEGRGLAIQRWWSRSGLLLATCLQEVGDFYQYLADSAETTFDIGGHSTETRSKRWNYQALDS